jgi:uncharacterized membrane protein
VASTRSRILEDVTVRACHAGPIGITGVGGTLLAGICAVLYRGQRRVWLLLSAACVLGAIGSLVTIVFNIPVNERLATWNPKALPPDYLDYLRQWWQWHHVRLVAMFVAMCLVFAAMLVRKSGGDSCPG